MDIIGHRVFGVHRQPITNKPAVQPAPSALLALNQEGAALAAASITIA